MSFIIVGSGFLKANISVIVGQLYNLTDVRRDGAYTIFYMGINVGAAIGTILVGYLGETMAGATASALAGIGMLAGLIVFVLGKKSLMGQGEAPNPQRLRERSPDEVRMAALRHRRRRGRGDLGPDPVQDVIQNLLIVSGIGLLGYVLYESFKLRAARARPDVRDPVPDRLEPVVLGPVRAGRRQLQPLHRSLRRPRRGSGVDVPVDQPDLHHPARRRCSRGCGWRSASAGSNPRLRPSSALALLQVGLGFLVFVWGANIGRREP